MPNYDAGSGAGTLRLELTTVSQNVAGNYSTLQWKLFLICGNGSSFNNSPTGWEVILHGIRWAGEYTFDFRGTTVKEISSGYFDVVHRADGTQEVGGYGYSAAPGVSAIPGSMQAIVNPNYQLTTIPRASNPTFSANPVDAGTSVTINMNRASSAFTHTVQYTFGSSSGTIATGVTTSTSWAIPLSLLSQIPSAMSGVAQITVTTYNGGTTIGTRVVNLTIRVPSSVTPDFTTVTHSEATTSPNVASIVGAYVKGFSKLAVAITGATGAYGSTISSYKIEVAGQTINAASGTTGVLNDNGTLTLRGTITDSRGQTKVKDVSVTVMNYTPPAITAASAVRSTVGGSVDANGTYIKVDMTAVVQSLIVGSQKNNLNYAIKTRLSTSSTPWSSISPVVSASAGSTGYSDDNIIGTYPVSNSYTVRIEVSDNLGSVAALELTITTGGTQMHFSKTVDGVGIGKYHEFGTLDVLGDIYTDGEIVISASALAAAIDARMALENPLGSLKPYLGGSVADPYVFADGTALNRTGKYAALFALIGTSWGVGNGSTTFNVPDLRKRTLIGAQSAVAVGTATFNNTTDVVTLANHGFVEAQKVYFTGGTMPTGITASTEYFVRNVSATNAFQLSTTATGAILNFTSNGSGTITGYDPNYALARTGGQEMVTLGVNELPSHSHGLNTRDYDFGSSPAGGGDNPALGASNTTLRNNSTSTVAAGGGQAHENMMPFAAVNWLLKAV